MTPVHTGFELADGFIIPRDPEYTLALSPAESEDPIRQEWQNDGNR